MKKERRFLQLVDDSFEDLELWYPVLRAREAGITVDLAGREKGRTYIGKYGVPATPTLDYSEVNPDEYDGVFIPGGWAPDRLRRYPELLAIVRRMDETGKILAQICHAGWVLISADVLKGRAVTGTVAIRDDLVNAGAIWKDDPVVVDGRLVSAQGPQDLPRYMEAILTLLESDRPHEDA